MTRLTRQILVFTLGLGVPSWAVADQPMTGSRMRRSTSPKVIHLGRPSASVTAATFR